MLKVQPSPQLVPLCHLPSTLRKWRLAEAAITRHSKEQNLWGKDIIFLPEGNSPIYKISFVTPKLSDPTLSLGLSFFICEMYIISIYVVAKTTLKTVPTQSTGLSVLLLPNLHSKQGGGCSHLCFRKTSLTLQTTHSLE